MILNVPTPKAVLAPGLLGGLAETAPGPALQLDSSLCPALCTSLSSLLQPVPRALSSQCPVPYALSQNWPPWGPRLFPLPRASGRSQIHSVLGDFRLQVTEHPSQIGQNNKGLRYINILGEARL